MEVTADCNAEPHQKGVQQGVHRLRRLTYGYDWHDLLQQGLQLQLGPQTILCIGIPAQRY